MITPVFIRVGPEDFDPGSEIDQLRTLSQGKAGAICHFTGVMRDHNQGDEVIAMELEHYPGMTEKALQKISLDASQRWELLGISIIHRVGMLNPGDHIVQVACASTHRKNSFHACEFIMDYLKTSAPFWKKEYTLSGARWVDARESDQKEQNKWKNN
ncbi:MAG: molybdopterin synthase catalytic subunit MoaE [bacterium]